MTPNEHAASTLDWDDLRVVKAVAEGGSAVAAARLLGVNATTVQRRIARFEERAGLRLFDRLQTGYRPTADADAIIAAARDIDERIMAIDRDLLGRDRRAEGLVSVTTTETFLDGTIAAHLAGFRARYPDIELRLTLTNESLNLSRRDADIAIRPSLNPPETLIGVRVSGLAFAIYGRADRLPQGEVTIERLAGEDWIGLGPALSTAPPARWLATHVPLERQIITIDTFPGAAHLAAAGLGLAFLPCNVAADHGGLSRLAFDTSGQGTSLWLLTHREIRHAARIKAFMDHMAHALRGERVRLEGEEG